ncbi:MAG: M20 family metallopeptidase [Chloroflexi bacterium]|nr:M20 family metallopeptidase [Chloroflexota bacterium]
MTDPTDIKTRIAATIEAERGSILAIAHDLYANPEIAFQEVHAAALVADAVEAAGYVVERGVGSLPTAVRGTLVGGLGPDGPTIAVLAEYDALPGVGHGCGHDMMAASGVGAAIALAAIRDELAGRMVFLGTPAEEAGSGKAIMLDEGAFDGVDAALLFHPSDRTHTRVILLASEDVEVVFTGRESHAASDPWLGRNALDALITLFSSVGLWRQQLPPGARVHGIITHGGDAPNIIPGRTRAQWMIRARDQATYELVKTRFEALVRAAALATDCEAEVRFSGLSTAMRNNEVLARLWSANLVAAGWTDGEPVPELAGSSDMGNVSLVLPTIHPCLAMVPEGTPFHSAEVREASVSPEGDEVTLLAARLVAQTAWDLFHDPTLVAVAWAEHRAP